MILVKQVILPSQLSSVLKSDDSMTLGFNNLMPRRQKKYTEYILNAKKEQTKIRKNKKYNPFKSRLEKGSMININPIINYDLKS